MPWVFYDVAVSPLGHGAYDLSMIAEKVLEGHVDIEDVEKLVYEMQKSEYWIPAFPNDGKMPSGLVILVILGLWLALFLVLGGIHLVIGLSSILLTAGALLLAYVWSWASYYWIHSAIGDEYLIKREKAFIGLAERYNSANLEKNFKVEVGRYGAYIALRFNAPIKKLGALLMLYQRVYSNQQQKDAIEKQQDADML